MGLACDYDDGVKNAYKILAGKLLEKRPPLRPRRRREDNIKMDLGPFVLW
jgi:hypothetical protein